MRRVQTEVANGWYKKDEFYVETEKFCPKCGNKTVWKAEQDQDFYVGYDYACTTCEIVFQLPNFDEAQEDDFLRKCAKELIEKLK